MKKLTNHKTRSMWLVEPAVDLLIKQQLTMAPKLAEIFKQLREAIVLHKPKTATKWLEWKLFMVRLLNN